MSNANAQSDPNLKPEDLCDSVAFEILQTDPSFGTRFTYQSKIYELAGVNIGADTPEVIGEKIRNWWLSRRAEFVCSSINFAIPSNSNLLKLPVESNSRNFFNDMVRKWKVDLNYMDPADGKTVLDFAQDQLEKDKGTVREPVIQYYVTQLLKAGAKTSAQVHQEIK
jgi:hypothetical protein